MAQFQTKFNVGDKVVTLDPKTKKAIEVIIGYVMITTNMNETKVKYSPMTASGSIDYLTDYEEDLCFNTKDQLIEYICN